jgi:hypothetical protein
MVARISFRTSECYPEPRGHYRISLRTILNKPVQAAEWQCLDEPLSSGFRSAKSASAAANPRSADQPATVNTVAKQLIRWWPSIPAAPGSVPRARWRRAPRTHGCRRHPAAGAGCPPPALRRQEGAHRLSRRPGAKARPSRSVPRRPDPPQLDRLIGDKLQMICVDWDSGFLAALPTAYPDVPMPIHFAGFYLELAPRLRWFSSASGSASTTTAGRNRPCTTGRRRRYGRLR